MCIEYSYWQYLYIFCCPAVVPADIDSGPSVQQVVEGNGATLFCNATGNPRPNITWTKEGSNSVLSKSESLTLTNLTRKQNGSVYTCKVKNSLGPAKEASAMITVLGAFSLSFCINNLKLELPF